MRASHTASGASCSGPRIGRHTQHHLDAALQQFLGFVGEQVADPLRARARGVVDMDAGRRLARPTGRAVLHARHAAALEMIEDKDAAGAGDLGDKALGFW